MNGEQHYIEAERILEQITLPTPSGRRVLAEGILPQQTALAQVHATLALVYAANRAQTEAYGLLRAMIDARDEERDDR